MITRGLLALGLLAGVTLGGAAYRRNADTRARSGPKRVDPARLPTDGPGVLAFTSELCLACRETPALVAQALDVREDELRAGEAPLAFAQVDVGQRADLAEALAIRRTPAMAGLEADGTVRFVQEGNPEADELAERLAALREA